MIVPFALFSVKHIAGQWIQKLGGPGLIAVGLIDNSVIPFPGGMDFFTILLAMSHHELWWYYALMATAGSVIGGYLTYRVGVKGGEETLEKKVPKKRAEKVRKMFEKRGFLTIVVGALLPPPVPISPFFIVPGALKYPTRKFLLAVTTGRLVRYMAVAYLASIYGRTVFHWMYRSYRPILYVLLALLAVGSFVGLYYWKRYRHNKKQQPAEAAPTPKAA
jgi:membrane protein YqaA with SNARE-associated domain